MDFSNIFNASLIYATFRSATPIIYAALCAAITQQADILNIGTEGIMLIGAFMAVAVSYLTGSWALGVVVAMISGLIIAMVMAVGNIKFKADICAIGMGINYKVLVKCMAWTERYIHEPRHQINSKSKSSILGRNTIP